MKALILAAGLGTRLRPHTLDRPKALFPLAGRPLLDRIIEQLVAAGIDEIVINTHHLAEHIETFVSSRVYAVPVHTRREPAILGTAGAIGNLADFWDDQPFVVINSDIVTDIDLAAVGRFHCSHAHAATLVLTDWPRFNTVTVDPQGFVVAFSDPPAPASGYGGAGGHRRLTFTGIQILTPAALKFIPAGRYYSSIDMYRRMLAGGLGLKALVADRNYWTDIGTPRRFREAALRMTAPAAFQKAWPHERFETVTPSRLSGDGSDRRWYRLAAGERTLIMADHGIRGGRDPAALEAFVSIGRHLHRRQVAVPRIYAWDPFAGFVFLEDLGATMPYALAVLGIADYPRLSAVAVQIAARVGGSRL